MFVDQAKIWIASGHGGSGCVSFRREKYMPKGGPDGGDGGDGGSVIFICDPHMRSLYDFTRRKHIRAQRGEHGKGANKSGKNGRDVEIKVPAGTQLYSDETGELIGEITTDQDRLVVTKQREGLAFEPNLMLINDADRQARWYFQIKREYAQAQAEGRPFTNPIEPAVLTWRS